MYTLNGMVSEARVRVGFDAGHGKKITRQGWAPVPDRVLETKCRVCSDSVSQSINYGTYSSASNVVTRDSPDPSSNPLGAIAKSPHFAICGGAILEAEMRQTPPLSRGVE